MFFGNEPMTALYSLTFDLRFQLDLVFFLTWRLDKIHHSLLYYLFSSTLFNCTVGLDLDERFMEKISPFKNYKLSISTNASTFIPIHGQCPKGPIIWLKSITESYALSKKTYRQPANYNVFNKLKTVHRLHISLSFVFLKSFSRLLQD